MKRGRLCSGIAAAILAMSVTITGCGKKGDPVPPRVNRPAVISDLAAASVSAGVELRWSVPGKGGVIGSFKILRSETADGGQSCPGCPQDYRLLAAPTLADGRLRNQGDGSFRYVDTDTRAGRIYSYRIAVCAPAGHCGDASNEAGLISVSR